MINNYNHSHFFSLLLLGWILVFAACKSPIVPSSRTPIKDIEIKELTKSIAKNQLDYKKLPWVYSKVRKRIKTLFSQLCDQFMIQRNYAKTFKGFATRVMAKITALTVIQWKII